MEFVTFELAKKLKEKGFSYGCLFVYNKEQVINPEIIKEFGELSDDGYYELTKHGGGIFDWDFVYIYETQLIQYRDVIIEGEIVKAPTISQVLKWLREQKNINVEIFLFNGTYSYYVKSVTQICEDLTHQCLNDDTTEEEYNSYEEAAIAGIEYCLNNLI